MNAREIYERTKKPRDLPWNLYVCRPLAALVVLGIYKTKITPNQVTLFAAAVAALASVLLIFLPGYRGVLCAVVVYQLSYILDCVDGMLARLRNVQSIQGHLLDFLMDELKAFLILAAASVRLYMDRGDVNFLLAGMLGLVGLGAGVGMTTFLRRPEMALAKSASTPTTGTRPSWPSRLVGWVETVGHWLIHYPSYIWLAALLGRMELYLLPYVVVNAAYAARAFVGIALRFGRTPTAPAVRAETHSESSADGAG